MSKKVFSVTNSLYSQENSCCVSKRAMHRLTARVFHWYVFWKCYKMPSFCRIFFGSCSVYTFFCPCIVLQPIYHHKEVIKAQQHDDTAQSLSSFQFFQSSPFSSCTLTCELLSSPPSLTTRNLSFHLFYSLLTHVQVSSNLSLFSVHSSQYRSNERGLYL